MQSARTILVTVLAVGLVAFTSAWCCCMGKSHTGGSHQVARVTSAALTGSAMPSDHGCCTSSENAPSDSDSPADAPASPAPLSDCGCSVNIAQTSTPQTLTLPALHATGQLPAFHLALLTMDWLQPVSIAIHPSHAPPESHGPVSTGQSLLALSCQLTI